MAVAYVNKQESTRTSSAAAFAPTLPTGWTVGNLLILTCISFGTGGPTITTPTGWTKIIDGDDNSKRMVTNQSRLYVWVKVAASSEPAPSLSPSAASYFHCLIEEYSGQDTTTPLNGTASAGTLDTDANINTPAITTTVPSTMIVYVCANWATGGTNNTPAGTTSRHNAVFASLGSRLMASEVAQAAAATVAATNHTRTTTGVDGLAATLAIQPPAAAPAFTPRIISVT